MGPANGSSAVKLSDIEEKRQPKHKLFDCNYLPAQNACETLAKLFLNGQSEKEQEHLWQTRAAKQHFCHHKFQFCSSFRLILTFAFRKTLIESKYKHILPPHRRASRRARITRLTDFDCHSHSRSQSVVPVHQRTDDSKMLVCGQAVILVPSPSLSLQFFTSF